MGFTILLNVAIVNDLTIEQKMRRRAGDMHKRISPLHLGIVLSLMVVSNRPRTGGATPDPTLQKHGLMPYC
jgi:hypothetical protein